MVRLRMQRHGRTHRPFYRIVAADGENPRDGRYLELIGTMDPLQDPPIVNIKKDRVEYWLSVGAQPSASMASLIKREMPGHLEGIEKARLDKIQARRAKRAQASA